MEQRRWKAALEALDALLRAHAGQAHVRRRGVEIVDTRRRCSFRATCAAPRLEEAVSGRLIAGDPHSGRIQLEHTPETLPGDCPKVEGLPLFAGEFVGPYALQHKMNRTETRGDYPIPSRFRSAIRRSGLQWKNASLVSSSSLDIPSTLRPDFRTCQYLRVHAMTARRMVEGDRHRCVPAGLAAGLARPVRPREVLEAVPRRGSPSGRPGPVREMARKKK